MTGEADKFVAEVRALGEPRWLSFVGKSGTGKTMLCDEIITRCWYELKGHRSLLNGIERITWTGFVRKLRATEYWRLDDAADRNLLFIDDIGTVSDTAFSLEQLYTLLELRNRKWTLITSNLTLLEIGKSLDTRIASRLIRGRNVCVEVDTLDYALRENKPRQEGTA